MSDLRSKLVVLLLCASSQLLAQSAMENDGYEVVRKDEKIIMYERWTPYPGTTTNSRQIKCVFYTNTDINNIYAHIFEESKIRTWQENILEYKIIPKNDSLWIAYSSYRVPWPLSNQDYLLTYSVLEKNENRIALSFTHLEDEKLVAIRKGIVRRPSIGKWELEKITSEKTNVTYTITSLPLNYPRFITDRLAHNNLMSSLNKLILVAEK